MTTFITGFTPSGQPVFSMDSPGLPLVIPSYLYTWYQDDDDLQAFVATYNSMTQTYVNWFNQIGLPIYPGVLIVGSLLDWVAEGIYGYTRLAGMSDDILKRTLTWLFYKGDGKYFNVVWLKRRVMRFLEGINGTDQGTATTYQVSVSFGAGYKVTINAFKQDVVDATYDGQGYSNQVFPNGTSQSVPFGFPNLYSNCCYNGNPPALILNPTEVPVNNAWTIALLAPFTNNMDLQSGIANGSLETPFQLQFNVTI
jgi:hypothetical protein